MQKAVKSYWATVQPKKSLLWDKLSDVIIALLVFATAALLFQFALFS
jgi:hypothetical protein